MEIELQKGFNNLGLDIFVFLYHVWLYHRLGISKKTTLYHLIVSAFNFCLLRQLILWILPVISFNIENTDQTISVVFQTTFFYLVQEFYMYGTHRLLHWSPFLYTYVHKMHHEVKGECFSTAMYMTSWEIIVHIFPDLMLGPLIWYFFNGFIYKEAFMIWTCLATFYFIWTHSGVMDSPYMPSTLHHWLHHKYPKSNFGSALSDNIFGTTMHEDK